MTVINVGTVSIGATLKATAAATAAVQAAVAMGLPERQARLAGAMALQANPFIAAPDIAGQLTAALSALTKVVADLTAINPGLSVTLAAAISAMESVQATIDGSYPDIAASLDAALNAIHSLRCQLKAGAVGANVNLTAMAALIAALGVEIGELDAQLDIAAAINANLSLGGLHVFRFDGAIEVAGAELDAAFAAYGLAGFDGESADAHFVVMVPTSGACWAGLQATVKTS